MSTERLQPVEPASIGDAVTHVVDVGERLVSHRLELAVVELRKTIENARHAAQFVLVALLLAGSGWIFAMIALLSWLEGAFGARAPAAAVIAAVQFPIAAVLMILRRNEKAT